MDELYPIPGCQVDQVTFADPAVVEIPAQGTQGDGFRRNRAEKEWTMPQREWAMAKAQFAVLFGQRSVLIR